MNKKTKHIVLTLKTWHRINKHRQDKEIGTGKESFEITLSELLDKLEQIEAQQ